MQKFNTVDFQKTEDYARGKKITDPNQLLTMFICSFKEKYIKQIKKNRMDPQSVQKNNEPQKCKPMFRSNKKTNRIIAKLNKSNDRRGGSDENTNTINMTINDSASNANQYRTLNQP